jgi:hypothetical protein
MAAIRDRKLPCVALAEVMVHTFYGVQSKFQNKVVLPNKTMKSIS